MIVYKTSLQKSLDIISGKQKEKIKITVNKIENMNFEN